MKELWQRIEKHKVPGLTVEYVERSDGLGWWEIIVSLVAECDKCGRNEPRPETSCMVTGLSPESKHRAAAMLVVDARRKQGWLFCVLDYEVDGVMHTQITATHPMYGSFSESTEDHDGDEARAIVTLLADVGDAMGELQ